MQQNINIFCTIFSSTIVLPSPANLNTHIIIMHTSETKFISIAPTARDLDNNIVVLSPGSLDQESTRVLFDIAETVQCIAIADCGKISIIEFEKFLAQYRKDQSRYFGFRLFREFHENIRLGLAKIESEIMKAKKKGDGVIVVSNDIKESFSSAVRIFKESLLA